MTTQVLWGVRNRHGKVVGICRTRDSASQLVKDRDQDQESAHRDLGGPWELVSGTIEWEAAP
jgi:hypothetical protein